MRFHQFQKRHEIHLWGVDGFRKKYGIFNSTFPILRKEKGTIANEEKLIEETGPTLDLVQ